MPTHGRSHRGGIVGICFPLSITGCLVAASVVALLVPTSVLASTTTTHSDGSKSHFAKNCPSLDLVTGILASTAPEDYAKNHAAYAAASQWHGEQLLHGTRGRGANNVNNREPAPYLACADYQDGRHALDALQKTFSPKGIHPVSNSEVHGSCFLVTASPTDGDKLITSPKTYGLTSAGTFVSTLKLAPGLLDHGSTTAPFPDAADVSDVSDPSARLRTSYGEGMKLDNVRGLSVRLSPGVLPVRASSLAFDFIHAWHVDLLADSLDMRTASFWSDPGLALANGGHIAAQHPEGALRIREWTRAAAVVHGLAAKLNKSPGEACKLERLRVRHIDDDLLVVEGIDHLLPNETSSEAKMACYMGLLSQLAAKPQVLRVSPFHSAERLNAVASAIVQSATTTATPLYDAGLDGKGEVIQVVDSGMDETSCFFADDDGVQVEHGYLFDGILVAPDGNLSAALGDYSFPFDLSRRKVVQYIELFKVRDEDDGDSSTSPQPASESEETLDDSDVTYFSEYIGNPYVQGDSSSLSSQSIFDTYDASFSPTTSTFSEESFCTEVLDDLFYHFSFLFDDSSYSSSSYSPSDSTSFTGGFDKDTVGGHGTWTAGIAAGAISQGSPYLTQDCSGDQLPACAGECVLSSDVEELIANDIFNIETYCPVYECDGAGATSSNCLGDDPLETLVEHSGVARGAQISLFDVGYKAGFYDFLFWLAGNFLWTATDGTGTKIHSNSLGAYTLCTHTEFEFLYETFMFENPQNLLIFAAGNDGGRRDTSRQACTMASPALSKNILSVGATSSGPSRVPFTHADGRLDYDAFGLTNYSPEGYPWICLDVPGLPFLGTPSTSAEKADIDTMAWFSSYGPSPDGRIKPEVVAPGDTVFGASGDGNDDHSCKLMAGIGTSAACPVVAGSAALVRQYFTDSSFYAHDMNTRGLCSHHRDSYFPCTAFAPSSATVKAMLINTANLMGGSAEPDNSRGFGRVHLEAGMPLNGDGDLALFVADSKDTSIHANSEDAYIFAIDGTLGLELRATLCWLDPPTTALSAQQLQHDLDLTVTAPSGEVYTMWETGVADTVNVNERVIVPVQSTESGMWSVTVSSKSLLTDVQSYSLVVTGAISNNVHE